jgi:hypothetical protein
MDYFTPNGGSYIQPWLPGWPIELERKTVRITGKGDERLGWGCAEDIESSGKTA